LKLEKAGKKLRENVEVEENKKYILDNHELTMELYSKVIDEVKSYLVQEGKEV